MAEGYLETGLWKRSLGADENVQEVKDHLERMRGTYKTFRDRASQLTNMISQTLPELTDHSITHLDSLWEIADLIAGPDYPLNPIEGFVLGGAILLHDAALCFEAYKGGKDGLRRTVEWKDCYAAECGEMKDEADADLLARADFATLRRLHAKQASQLGERDWQAPDGARLFSSRTTKSDTDMAKS